MSAFQGIGLPEVKAERPAAAIRRGALHASASRESMTVAGAKKVVFGFYSRVCTVEESQFILQQRCLTAED